MAPTVFEKADNFTAAADGNLLAVLWHGETTDKALASIDRAMATIESNHPQGLYLLTVIESTAPTPSAEVRDRLAKLLAEHAGTIKASAVAFEGSGFRAAAVRAVVTGLTIVAKQAFPHRVFSSVDEAAEWLAQEWPAGGATPSRLRTLVAGQRR